jgi:hypothetical protein
MLEEGLEMETSTDKIYTSDGMPVKILCTDRSDQTGHIVGMYIDGSIGIFNLDGTISEHSSYHEETLEMYTRKEMQTFDNESGLFWNESDPESITINQSSHKTEDENFQGNLDMTQTNYSKLDKKSSSRSKRRFSDDESFEDEICHCKNNTRRSCTDRAWDRSCSWDD